MKKIALYNADLSSIGITTEGNNVIVSYEENKIHRDLKDGDIVYCGYEDFGGCNYLTLVKKQNPVTPEYMTYHALLMLKSNDPKGWPNGSMRFNGASNVNLDILRLATDEEKELFFNALKKKHLEWKDGKISKIRMGSYYFVNIFGESTYTNDVHDSGDNKLFYIGNYFYSREEADEFGKKVRGLFAENLRIK